jgi:hypothetical protein
MGLSVLADDLRTIGLSERLVTQIVTFLNSRAGDLQDARPHGVGNGAFGSSPASTGCAGDAAKAHEHVYKAITDMVAGLKGYQTSIQDMAGKTFDVDTTTEAEMRTHIRRAEACVAPTFASASSCTLPGSSNDTSGGDS